MNESIEYRLNNASEVQIAELLRDCDADFVPRLSERVNITDYARKISAKAFRFEAWAEKKLVGLVAAYCNDREKRVAYITSVSVRCEWAGKGIANHLIGLCIEHSRASRMLRISLDVARGNTSALKLYKKNGFIAGKTDEPFISMHLFFENPGIT